MPTFVPIQIIFFGVFLITGRQAADQVTPAPICPDAQHDPESICALHISRASSAFALTGFGYMPGFFSSVQPASPRYIRLNEDFDLMSNSGLARYNSVPSLKLPEFAPTKPLSAALAETETASTAFARGQSVPIMVRPLKQAHSLSPQSLKSPHSAQFSSRPSAAEFGLYNPLFQSTASSAHDEHTTAVPSVDSEPAQLPAVQGPMLGAFAPIAFPLKPTTSDVLVQLLAAVPGLHPKPGTSDKRSPTLQASKSKPGKSGKLSPTRQASKSDFPSTQ